MNDELQKALAEILNKVTKGAETGVGFLQRELPEVIQQLLMWHAVRSAIFCVAFLAAAVLFVYATKRLWIHLVKEDCGGEPFAIFPAFVSAGFIFAAMCETAWLQILIAPKLYLIEYTAALVK